MKPNPIIDAFSRATDRTRDLWFDLGEAISGIVTNTSGPIKRLRGSRIRPVTEGDRRRSADLVESGRKYYNARRYHKSERYFKKAVATDESYARAHYYHGLSLYQIHLPSSAKDAWRRATEVEPDSESAQKAKSKLEKKLVYRNKTSDRLTQTSKGK